jgi:3-methylcrotonyl-CoA carboxylase alpha subunit
MRYSVVIAGETRDVELTAQPGGDYRVRVAGFEHPARVTRLPDGMLVEIGDRQFQISLDGDAPEFRVHANGCRFTATVVDDLTRARARSRAGSARAKSGVVTSPMPGKVVQVLVVPGQEIAAGAPVVVVEAMKMENQLVAACDGVVREVLVRAGDAVDNGARLVVIE